MTSEGRECSIYVETNHRTIRVPRDPNRGESFGSALHPCRVGPSLLSLRGASASAYREMQWTIPNDDEPHRGEAIRPRPLPLDCSLNRTSLYANGDRAHHGMSTKGLSPQVASLFSISKDDAKAARP
eukprot:976465-Prymnesium_polylepis.2